MKFKLNPINRKRLTRFRRTRRAWWSLWILVTLYILGLMAELICNSNPYIVRFNDTTYYPFLAGYTENFGLIKRLYQPTWGIYPETTFLGNDVNTPPDYKALARNPAFTDNPANYMVWAPVPYDANEIVQERDLKLSTDVDVSMAPHTRVASIDIDPEFTILTSTNAAGFLGVETEPELRQTILTERLVLPPRITNALAAAFRNEPTVAAEVRIAGHDGEPIIVSLRAYEPRRSEPPKLRLRLEELPPDAKSISHVVVAEDDSIVSTTGALWARLSEDEQKQVLDLVGQRREKPIERTTLELAGASWRLVFDMDDFAFPYRPKGVHVMGIDDTGRDVLARILYALRISLNFGFLLVTATYIIGIFLGGLQGFFGGWLDIVGQRFIEVWGTLPFLYMIILFGSIFGPSFMLLLCIYAVFNWIGISYYMRGEFLKLRQEPFVDAARVMGIPSWRIMFRHMLPNALVPIITIFPFSLVGAIGSLTALDYLGFGLPEPTPSWGELLAQYQSSTDAWWLVVYPFLILFLVVLLGVLIGDGLRNAFDPRNRSHLE